MMIYLFTLIVFSSRQLPPPSLRAHLNNYYNPEECKLRGTHSGEKLGPWITHLHFPPRGIQTFILWSHPSFRDSNNEPLLHCNAILAFSFKTDSKWIQISLLLCYFLRLSWIPQEEGIMAMYNDCGENKAWWSWWLWRHLKSPGSSDDHPPTDRKSLGSNWWALISGDTDKRHLEQGNTRGKATSGETGKFSHHSSRFNVYIIIQFIYISI